MYVHMKLFFYYDAKQPTQPKTTQHKHNTTQHNIIFTFDELTFTSFNAAFNWHSPIWQEIDMWSLLVTKCKTLFDRISRQ